MFPTPSRAPASLDDAERTAASSCATPGRFARRIALDAGGTKYWRRRRASASGRSSTAIFCRDRRPRSSRKAPRATSLCWRDGTRTKASTSPCCRAPTRSGRIPSWSREIFGERSEEPLGHYPGGRRKRRRRCAGAGRRPHHHPRDLGIARSASQDRTLGDLPLPLRTGAADSRGVVGEGDRARPAPFTPARSCMSSTICMRFPGCTKTPIASWRNCLRAIGSISS